LSRRYVEAVLAEIDIRRHQLPEAGPSTIYIGGGTPSFLPKTVLRHLLDGLRSRFDINATEEFTIEVNPDDVTADLLSLLRQYGVTRISMGVQSFDDNQLKLIGRRHNGDRARTAIKLLNDEGWNFSLDLIYGLPGQSLMSWQEQLNELLRYNPPHFSAYLLSLEEGTPLYRMEERGEIHEASEDLIFQMYDYLCNYSAGQGYDHYEISNFAKPGKYAIHNSRYWLNNDYTGVGIGASSYNNNLRGYNPEFMEQYIAAIELGRTFTQYEAEKGTDIYNTILFVSLRTRRGLELNDLPNGFHSAFLDRANKLISKNLLEKNNTRFTIPEKEWLRSDFIIRELMEP